MFDLSDVHFVIICSKLMGEDSGEDKEAELSQLRNNRHFYHAIDNDIIDMDGHYDCCCKVLKPGDRFARGSVNDQWF